jgi:hypothetical protein
LAIQNAIAMADMKIHGTFAITAKCDMLLFNLLQWRNGHLCAIANIVEILPAQVLKAQSI